MWNPTYLQKRRPTAIGNHSDGWFIHYIEVNMVA
jgi:hypothetical protein